MRWRAAAIATAFALVAAAGCGDSDEPNPPSRPAERIDALPELPSGWKPHVNHDGGFALGVPRGWKASDRGSTTLLRSFDHLVAVSIAPDRTGEALELPLGEFAVRALAALPGFQGEIEPGEPRPFEHRYEAASVSATAIATRGRIEQHLDLIVLRRDRLATLTVMTAANAERDSGPARRVAERVVATLRSRPVAAPSA